MSRGPLRADCHVTGPTDRHLAVLAMYSQATIWWYLPQSQGWHTLIGVDVPNSSRSGIFDLDSNERLRFLASSGIVDASDSPANFYLRSISSVFYEAGADIPYRGYVYLAFGRGVDLAACEEFDDDTLIFHRSSDGATENLFVESPDRPFYLERDKEDPALGRLVVSFVPSANPRPSYRRRPR